MPEAWPAFTPARDRRLRRPALRRGRRRGDRRASPATRSTPPTSPTCAREAYATFTHAAVVAAEAARARRLHGRAVPRPEPGLQGRGHAAAGPALRPRAGRAEAARRPSSAPPPATPAARRSRPSAAAPTSRIVALFPEGRISEVQRRFMTTAADANVACVAVTGTFDDCQAIVKDAFQDQALRQAVDLSGVNSINFARIAAQAVYYFTTAVALGAPDRPVAFACRPATSATPSPATSPAAWACRSSASSWPPTPTTSWPAPSRTGRYARGEVQADPVARPWTSSRLQLRAALLRGRRAATAVETARAFAGLRRRPAPSTSRPRRSRPCASCSAASRSARTRPRRTILATLNETGELIDPHTAVAVAALAPAWAAGTDAAGGALHRPPGQVPRGGRRPPRASTPALPRGVGDLAGAPGALRPAAGRRRRGEGLRPRLREGLSTPRPASTPSPTASASSAIPSPGSRPWRSPWSPAAARAGRTRRRSRLVAPAGAHGVQGRRRALGAATSSR